MGRLKAPKHGYAFGHIMLSRISDFEPDQQWRAEFSYHRLAKGSDYSEVNDFAKSQLMLAQ